MGAPKSCRQLRGQDLKLSLPLSASRLLGGGQIKSRRRQLSSTATALCQRRVQSSRPKHRNKKKWPRQSSDRRLVTTDILTPSKETHPNHDPDPTQKQHGNLALVSPSPKRQCKSGPTRSDRPFPLSGSCHVTTTEANPHTTQKPNEQKSKKSEANSESRGAVWMLSVKLNLNDNIEDEDNGRSGPPDKRKTVPSSTVRF